jgi:uncharacterized tellurite resistance protein B-like protein
MEFKDKLAPEDWNTLLYSVLWVFHSVAGADGIIDKKEQLALKTICSKAGALGSSLAEEILLVVDENIGTYFRQSMNDQRDFRVGLMEAIKVLNKSIPPEKNLNFRKILLAIGFYIGNVSGEGEGSKLSKEEMKVIGMLAGLLQISKDDMNKSPTVSEIMGIFAS